jgi:O-antigen/teichoic acid export membrane protein
MSSPTPNASTDGRERFGRNVAFAWGGYMVNVVAGFVVPRMISDHLGQTTLGIWDFAWSFVSYFGLVQLGLGGSISRYVAKFRARNDVEGLSRSVSTIAVFQRSVGWLAMVLAVLSAFWVLPMFGAKLGDAVPMARWVLLFLGVEIALSITLSVYGAVIVGCHRWDLHNSVSAAAYGVVAVGMIAVLLLGGGLPELALVHCVVMVGGQLVRRPLSRKVCPELRIEWRLASWRDFKEQARYSVKTMLPSISSLLSNQALSLLIAGFLGPASLAVFSRARSLTTTLSTLAMKFGNIVVPTASALQARNDQQALRDTLFKTPAIISCLTLPVIISMGMLGDHVIRLWMGEAYVLQGLVPILCVGTYATVVQEPVWSLLSGMNAHGRIALAKLGAACFSALLLTLGLWWQHWGLLGAAFCFVLPQLLVDGLFVPWDACRRLAASRLEFLWRVHVRPGLCVVPYAFALWYALNHDRESPLAATLEAGAGAAVSAFCYLKWLVPASLIKGMIDRARISTRGRRAGAAVK